MKRIFCFIGIVSLVCWCGIYGVYAAGENKAQKQQEQAKAKSIDTSAKLESTHPEIPAGVSCNDCHEVKLDANTTATQVWLSGDSPGKKAGEGIMPKERVWQEFNKMVGNKKNTRTFVIATCLNNEPLSTTAEFALDPDNKVLYGFHEKGTEKLLHIQNNPKVSLNWHKEFESFADFRCVQVKGHAELIESSNPEFEKALINFLPYEKGVRIPENATPQQAEDAKKQMREMFMKGNMVITKIHIDRITMANMEFSREGFRRYQRWTP